MEIKNNARIDQSVRVFLRLLHRYVKTSFDQGRGKNTTSDPWLTSPIERPLRERARTTKPSQKMQSDAMEQMEQWSELEAISEDAIGGHGAP
jgi:hypothetical protein